MNKITAPKIRFMKNDAKVVMVTAYDATTANIVDEAGVDIILVGDSLGNVIQGSPHTLAVTMDEMIYHTKIVSRGIKNAHLCADMPFMSFQLSREEAIRNAGRLVKEAGAESVKIEIAKEQLETLSGIYNVGIPVIGHIGLRPQAIHYMGGYKLQGRTRQEADDLMALAREVEEAGAFSLLLEGIPQNLATKITEAVGIPTIGISAGPGCDGQVLVINDLLGLSEEPLPKFVKKYANLRRIMTASTKQYAEEVRNGLFPSAEHSHD